ncbi:MAG: 3-phenylpropionate/trans-cinnamate dioxygenase ferredoxin reductase component [Pseudonocardiales bacterium]|jgi:3-phenylpropionate/trans-cinnamate dioxygenase ferredoxin reductase subunit|nr:3-phenylpropionate/trans-cinnamate dioxygenase ferredoxin reductase component [Pseudonocardiales bacterium]
MNGPVGRPDVDHFIIGGGPAAVACAQRLRELDPAASVLVTSRELDPPYDRTLCSKSYLRGGQSRDATHLRAADWWDSRAIELRTGTSVTGLDTTTRTARLSSRDEVSFGQALLATGATVRRITCDGSSLAGIHYLRALGNADAIRRDVEQADDVVLVGGSYIGCEVAATLTATGKRCTVLMRENTCFEHHLGSRGGRFLQDVLEQRGVRFVAGDELERFEGDGSRVTHVVTRAGRALAAQAVVVGVGAQPDVRLARGAGLRLGATGGVHCDAQLRTSARGIFAAGDMCEWDSAAHRGRARVEHWDVAAGQGRAAAANMLGGNHPYAEIPTFWSDLADWVTIRFHGVVAGDTRIERGAPQDGAFSIWYLDGEELRGVLSIGRDQDLSPADRLIGTQLSAEQRAAISDPHIDLAELARTAEPVAGRNS